MPDVSDKAPLEAYLLAVMDGVLGAIEKVESAHPGWEVGAVTFKVKAALKPQTSADGKHVTVWADMDVASSELVSEIPISIRRNVDGPPKP